MDRSKNWRKENVRNSGEGAGSEFVNIHNFTYELLTKNRGCAIINLVNFRAKRKAAVLPAAPGAGPLASAAEAAMCQ